MTVRIRSITIDCADHYRLAEFWSQTTGWQEDPDNPNQPVDPESLLVSADRQLNLLFIPVPEGKRDEPRTAAAGARVAASTRGTQAAV